MEFIDLFVHLEELEVHNHLPSFPYRVWSAPPLTCSCWLSCVCFRMKAVSSLALSSDSSTSSVGKVIIATYLEQNDPKNQLMGKYFGFPLAPELPDGKKFKLWIFLLQMSKVPVGTHLEERDTKIQLMDHIFCLPLAPEWPEGKIECIDLLASNEQLEMQKYE